MRGTIMFFMMITTLYGSAQQNNSISFSLSQNILKEIGLISNMGLQYYSGSCLKIGYRFENKKSDLEVGVIYCYSGSLSGHSKYFISQNHSLGSSLKYSFVNKGKKIKPFLNFNTLIEIASNYRNGFLLIERHIPSLNPSATYYYPSVPGGEYTVDYYYSNFYHSTPLASSLLGGIDIKLNQNLSLNIAAGYAFRIMKVKYAEWKEKEDVYKKLETIPTENVFSHFLDVQLGLSYDFPLKKTSKSKYEL